MVMALRTFHGEPHPDIRGGLHPVSNILDSEFLGKCASFVTGGVVAIETGGDFLINRGIGNEVAGNLLDRKLVEGLV